MNTSFVPQEPKNLKLAKVYRDLLLRNKSFNKSFINDLKSELRKLPPSTAGDTVLSQVSKFNYADFKKCNLHRVQISIEPILYILQELTILYEENDYDKLRIMASAVHNYPYFILGRNRFASEEFFNQHICYFNRSFHNEEFMMKYEFLFKEEYPKTDKIIR